MMHDFALPLALILLSPFWGSALLVIIGFICDWFEMRRLARRRAKVSAHMQSWDQ